MDADLINFLLADADEACSGDKDKMALYLAGVAAGAMDSAWDATSGGFVRRNPGKPYRLKPVPQAVLTTNEIIEGLDDGD